MLYSNIDSSEKYWILTGIYCALGKTSNTKNYVTDEKKKKNPYMYLFNIIILLSKFLFVLSSLILLLKLLKDNIYIIHIKTKQNKTNRKQSNQVKINSAENISNVHYINIAKMSSELRKKFQWICAKKQANSTLNYTDNTYNQYIFIRLIHYL